MFTEGFTIDGKHSFADYGLNVKQRQLTFPTKKSIRKTVPFMSGYYDFTRINGNDTWGERLLSYTFDIIGDTPEEVEAECTRILNWLGNVHDKDIYEDCIPNYHWHGSFESANPAESEDGEQVELTVTFVLHPFKIANAETVIEGYQQAVLQEVTGQPIRPIIEGITGGRWYYRPSTAQQSANKYADWVAGTSISPHVLSAGKYVFGFTPTNMVALPYYAGTTTTNGMTFTLNNNGSITLNGTIKDAAAWFVIKALDGSFMLPAGQYKLSGAVSANILLRLIIQRGEENEYVYDRGNGAEFTVDEDVTAIQIAMQVAVGETASNLKVTPVIQGKVSMAWHEEVL